MGCHECATASKHSGLFVVRHQEAMSEDGVGSMIEGFDRQHIGGVQPRRMQSKPAPKQPVKALAPDASSSSTTEQDDVGTAGPLAHVQVRNVVQPAGRSVYLLLHISTPFRVAHRHSVMSSPHPALACQPFCSSHPSLQRTCT